MWDRWTGRVTDLESLAENLRLFFERKEFNAASEERGKNEYRIVAIQKKTADESKSLLRINVTIRGEPSDFRIEFSSSADSRPFSRFANLSALIGAGIFALRELKSTEKSEKLEKEFWKYVDEAVDLSERQKTEE